MNHKFPALLIGAGLLTAATGCSSMNSAGAARVRSTDEQQERIDLVEMILSLPAFQYHEESRKDFEKGLRSARALPRNQKAPETFLFYPGDGTFPAREFSWSEKDQVLTVTVSGSDVDPPYTDKWAKTSTGLRKL